jgi:hypothetical protein
MGLLKIELIISLNINEQFLFDLVKLSHFIALLEATMNKR